MADIGITVLQLILSLGKGHCIKAWEMAGKSSVHMKSGGGRSVALTYLPSCRLKTKQTKKKIVSQRLAFLILVSKMQPWDNYIKGPFRNSEKGWISISCLLIFNTKFLLNSCQQQQTLFVITLFTKMCTDRDKQFQNTVCDKHKTCLVMDMSFIEDLVCQTHSKYSLLSIH